MKYKQPKLFWKRNFSYVVDMFPIFRLINVHFWKSYIGPFFAFIFPIIFIAILGNMIGYDSMFGGFMSTAVIAVAMCSMPQAIFEFKQSTLLKRIGATPIKPWMFMTASGFYYILIMIAGTIFSFIAGIAIFSGNWDTGRAIADTFFIPSETTQVPLLAMSVKDTLLNINWGGFIWANIMNIMVSVSLGLLFVSVCKSSMMITGIGIPILIISGFVTGQYLPLAMIKDGSGIMANLGYISPFKSPIALMLESWNGSTEIVKVTDINNVLTHYQVIRTGQFNIFDTSTEFAVLGNNPMKGYITIYTQTERILNLILPFIWAGIFTGISLKFFKWSV